MDGLYKRHNTWYKILLSIQNTEQIKFKISFFGKKL